MTGKSLLLLVISAISFLKSVTAFTASSSSQQQLIGSKHYQQQCNAKQTPSTLLFMAEEEESSAVSKDNNDLILVREFLKKNFPFFYQILDLNEDVWKAIGDTGDDGTLIGFTVFAPSSAAFEALGAEKTNQLMDERNLETTQKIAGYHVIGEPVTEDALFNSGGVLTVSGEVPIERSVSGGFFGIGGKEDGGVKLNNAKILRTAKVGNGLVHEVDDVVSPNIMWRYMDQLRIPGSS